MITWTRLRLEKLLTAFLVDGGSDWIDKDFFVTVLLLSHDADLSSEMEHCIDHMNGMKDVMKVAPIDQNESQVVAAMHKCEMLL